MSRGVPAEIKKNPPPEDELVAAPRSLPCRTGGALDESCNRTGPCPETLAEGFVGEVEDFPEEDPPERVSDEMFSDEDVGVG